MAALTADRDTHERNGEFVEHDMAATTEIFKGSLVVLDASGDAEPGTTATGKVAIGRSEEQVNNTGAAGAVTIKLKHGTFKWANSGGDAVTRAEIGDTCYIEDDQTVAKTATGKSAAGKVTQLDSDGVWVETRPPVASGLAAANNLSDVGSAPTSRVNLGVDKYEVCFRADNLVAADTEVFGFHATRAGTITSVRTVLEGAALAAGDATLTGRIDAVLITDGVVTITQAASAVGDLDSATPSAANVVAAGDYVNFTVGGANTDTDATATIIVELTI